MTTCMGVKRALEDIADSLSSHASDLDDMLDVTPDVPTVPSLVELRDDLRSLRDRIRSTALALTPDEAEEM